jgi:urease accessory protein
VLVLGGLLMVGDRTPAAAALVAAGVFGVFHGFVYGHEMPRLSSPALYVVGFLASTAGLHVLGALSGSLALCRPSGASQLRVAGAVVGVAGVYFAAQTLGVLSAASSLAR